MNVVWLRERLDTLGIRAESYSLNEDRNETEVLLEGGKARRVAAGGGSR